MVRAYSTYSGLPLTASYSESTTSSVGSYIETGVSGAQSSVQSFTFVVPVGMLSLSVVTTVGTGNPDMYLRFASKPTTSTYDCRPYKIG